MQEKTKAFNVLKTLYSFQDTLSKLIEDEQIKALSLDEYYIKLQILLSEDNDSVKAALHDKVTGEKKPVEIENIFKAIDVENRIRELLEKNYQVKEDIIKPLIEEENKLNLLYRNIPNKSELEIKYIAESINRIQADVGKVLLLGGAGIGKTTLMHYLSYKWGKDNLWNDKFDYVFRIKLKELLNENWSREYEAKELRQNKLACFIHYCLNLENIEPHEIINISNKDRVLLLLDGYDEVAFLSQDNRDYRDIMEAVFQYKNVIMSSRPNAITENINNKFERKVENTGWDSERIEKYVYKSFEHDQTLGTQLKSFLDTHSQIKEICEVPINTALICLIWSDPKIRDKFRESGNEDFNISRLYSEITYWLNNRYLAKTQHKYQHKYKSKTEANNHLKNIMSFLEQIAYESLSTTGKLVENKRVENNKDTLDIDEVIEQGLLRREGQNYKFIHLTFQEFLAARYLKNQLLDNHTKSKTASFIGEHRNEPKYLMTLKFLAGIANNDDSKELTEIFWEAATCNVNGILELGIEKKIALLMHLLAQSKIKDEFDNRIPHLKQIQNLIDDTVLKDITIWEQQIIDSGYLSEVIVRVVNEKLQSKEATFQELKTSTEIITTLANRNEWGSKTKVYESLINLLKIKNLKLQKVVLQKLVKILDETIDEEILKKSLKKIILSLGGDADKYIHITLAQIITIVPNSGKEILNELQKKSKTIIITSIINIIKTIPTQKSFAFLKNLPANPNYKIKIATTCSLLAIIKEMSTQEAFINLKDLLINPDCEIKYAAVRILPEIIKEIPELASEAITFLKEEIINPKPKYNITPIAIKSITKIVKILPNLILGTFNILKMVIINPHSEYNTKSEAIKSLADIVKVKPNLTQETFNFLKSLIINSNNEYEIEAKIIESIIEMVGVVPSLAQKAFVFLKEIITNSKFSYDVKVVAIENIVEILKIKPNLTQAAFSFLKLVITNFNINYNAKSKAIESITRLAKTKLSLIQETFIFLKEIITNPKTNQSIKSKAIESIAEIIEKKPSLAQETFILIKGIIANSNTNYDIESVTKSMTKIVKLNPIQEAFTFLKVAVMNSKIDAYVKAEAIESMAEVIKTIPSLAQEIITFLKKVIIDSDADYYVKYAAIKSIQKIVIEMPNLLPEIFIFFKSVIINSNTETYVKSDATYTITKILKAEPNLAQEAVDFLKEILIKTYAMSKKVINYCKHN